jgi:hypothetical protein
MKKILCLNWVLIAIIVAMSVGFASCSKDDDEKEKASSEILIGKWKDGDATLEFKKGGNFTFKRAYDKEKDEGTYKITDSAYVPDFDYDLDGFGTTPVTWFKLDLTVGKDVVQWLAVYDHEEADLLIYYVQNGIREEINSYCFNKVE